MSACTMSPLLRLREDGLRISLMSGAAVNIVKNVEKKPNHLVRDRVRVRARARDGVRVRIRGARGACGTLVVVPRTDRPWRLGVKLP